MADSVFPGALDDFINPNASDELDEVDHALQHRKANDALAALEAKVGEDGSDDHDSHDWKLVQIFLQLTTIDTELDGKAPLVHTHIASDVTDFATASDARIAAQRGVAGGIAALDGGGKVPITQLPSAIMEYQGVWNATTNSPSLVNGTGSTGDVYRVSVAGTQNFGAGAISFEVGDYVIYNGTVWEKSDTTDAVASVNGFTGVVSLLSTHIPEGSNLYYTAARVRAEMQPDIDTLMMLSFI